MMPVSGLLYLAKECLSYLVGGTNSVTSSKCGRWSMTSKVVEPLIHVHTLDERATKVNFSSAPAMGPRPLPSIQIEDESMKLYRRIHIYNSIRRIEFLNEANSILLKDPHNAPANQYRGWWHLSHEIDEVTAVNFLKRSIDSGEMIFSGRKTSSLTPFRPL